MLEAESISFRYAVDHPMIIDRVDWLSEAGTIEAFIGPNGAGKTTLLRLLTGEITPSGGSIQLESKPLADWAPVELARRRAVLSQSPRLEFAFTVEEVILMGRAPHLSESPAPHAVVNDLIDEMDLRPLARRPFPSLSRGEKQRVQLARVLAQLQSPAGRRQYLFLDEPVNHLDLTHQHHTLQAARDRARQGHAVIAVLHDLNLALQYADLVSVIRNGRIVARGQPEDVLSPELVRQVFGVGSELIHDSRGHPHLAIRARPRPPA